MCAVDLKVGTGTVILAPAGGKVVRTGFDSSGGGNFMVVEHGDRVSLYLHLNKFVASSGDVTRGQVIACSGTGGTGPHLHFSAMADTGLRSCVSLSGIDGNTNLSLGQTLSSSNQIVGTNPCSPSVTITPQPTLPPSGNPPNVPSMNAPSKDQAVLQETPITFEWDTSSNATQYLIEYSGEPYGTLNSGWQLATNYRVGTMWPGTYNWRIKARNSAGESAWSDSWTFTIRGPTQTPPPTVTITNTPQPQAPSVPSLRDPANGRDYSQSQDIWFTWDYATNANQYYLEYWGGPYGTLNSGWINDVAYHIGTMWPGTYKWHVKSRGQNGVDSNWSDTRSFTVTQPATSMPPTSIPPTGVPPTQPPPTAVPPTAIPPTLTPVPQPGTIILADDLTLRTESGNWPPQSGQKVIAHIKIQNGGDLPIHIEHIGVRGRRNGSDSWDIGFWTIDLNGHDAWSLDPNNERPLVSGNYSFRISYSLNGSTWTEVGSEINFMVP